MLPVSDVGLRDTKWLNDECSRLDIQNMALRQTLETLKKECRALTDKIEEAEEARNEGEISRAAKKRRRRVANEIPRHFQCAQCSKAYGYSSLSSEGSLNQHIRLKHEAQGKAPDS